MIKRNGLYNMKEMSDSDIYLAFLAERLNPDLVSKSKSDKSFYHILKEELTEIAKNATICDKYYEKKGPNGALILVYNFASFNKMIVANMFADFIENRPTNIRQAVEVKKDNLKHVKVFDKFFELDRTYVSDDGEYSLRIYDGFKIGGKKLFLDFLANTKMFDDEFTKFVFTDISLVDSNHYQSYEEFTGTEPTYLTEDGFRNKA